MSTTPDPRLMDDEAWHLALMQACTGLTAGANAIGRDRAARVEQTARLLALLRRVEADDEIDSMLRADIRRELEATS